jgi:cell wall-associated NlpC family hydrolase
LKKYVAILFSLMIILGAQATVAGAQPLTYTVQSGDSLWEIANQYGLSVDNLKTINNLKNDSLQIGQILKLSSASAPKALPVSASSGSMYVIQPGDCLGSIAIKHGMSVDELKALNGLQTDLIKAGKTLLVKNIPVVSSSPASAPASAPESTAVAEQQYVLQPGDSLYSVAEKYGISVSYLMQINNLQSDILDAGVTLRILPEAVPVSRSGAPGDAMRILKTAAQYLGTPYKYGGNGPGGFDCSGFAQYVFKQSGYNLPRTASGQYGLGTAVAKSNLQPGDLVFFACYSSSIDHVGIYSGSGQFIHSSSPRSGGVIYSSLSEGFYARTYVGAKRII